MHDSIDDKNPSQYCSNYLYLKNNKLKILARWKPKVNKTPLPRKFYLGIKKVHVETKAIKVRHCIDKRKSQAQ